MAHRALVVGSTGIIGQALTNRLLAEGWVVHGLARTPRQYGGSLPVAADLLNVEALRTALAEVRPTHVFFCTWTRRATERENCIANAAMVRNVFEALPAPADIAHAALVTGLKHYLGPFEAYAKGAAPETPFRESMPRLDVENFYYTQEDELYQAAEKHGFTWSVHRPHTVIGYAIGNVNGQHACRVCHALPGDRPPVRVSRFCRAVAWSDRCNGCAPAFRASAVGCNIRGRTE